MLIVLCSLPFANCSFPYSGLYQLSQPPRYPTSYWYTMQIPRLTLLRITRRFGCQSPTRHLHRMAPVVLHRAGTVFYHIAIDRIACAVTVNGTTGFGKGSVHMHPPPLVEEPEAVLPEIIPSLMVKVAPVWFTITTPPEAVLPKIFERVKI